MVNHLWGNCEMLYLLTFTVPFAVIYLNFNAIFAQMFCSRRSPCCTKPNLLHCVIHAGWICWPIMRLFLFICLLVCKLVGTHLSFNKQQRLSSVILFFTFVMVISTDPEQAFGDRHMSVNENWFKLQQEVVGKHSLLN